MDDTELDELFRDGFDLPEELDSRQQQQSTTPQRNNAQGSTTFDPLAGLFNEDPGQNQSAEKSTTRTRAPLKKLDPDVLLGDGGLTRLRHEAPFLEFNTERGYEEANLAKLMDYYRMWAHSLMPRLGFKDFSRQMMKATKHKRLKVVLHEWQKEHRRNNMPDGDDTAQGNRNDNNDDELSSSPAESSSDSEDDEDRLNLFLAGIRTETANKRTKTSNDNNTQRDDDRYLTVADMDEPQHHLNNNNTAIENQGEKQQQRQRQSQPTNNNDPMLETNNTASSKMDIDQDISDDEPLFVNKRPTNRKIVDDDD